MVKELKGLGYKPYKEIYLPIHMGEPDPCMVYMKPYGDADLCIMVNTRERVCDYTVHIDSKDLYKNIRSGEDAQESGVEDAWIQLMKDLEVIHDEAA